MKRPEEQDGLTTERNCSIPKICHFYWDNPKTLSVLHVVTLQSFRELNPDWKMILWMPENMVSEITWKEACHKQPGFHDDAERLFSYVRDQIPNLEIRKVDMRDIGFFDDCSEAHKADYLRYYMLQTHGGMWSDLDIVYLKSVEGVFDLGFDNIMFHCRAGEIMGGHPYYPAGLFLAKPHSKFFSHLAESAKTHYDKSVYQSIGPFMLQKIFDGMTIEDLEVFQGENNIILDNLYYLPYHWYETGLLYDHGFTSCGNVSEEKTIGVHWFNGHSMTPPYIRRLHAVRDWETPKIECYMDKVSAGYIKTISRTCPFYN